MPSVSGARGGGARFGATRRQRPWQRRWWWRRRWWRQPGLDAARRLLALELQVGGKAHRVDAVLLHRFLVAGGEFGVVFIAGARGVVDVI